MKDKWRTINKYYKFFRLHSKWKLNGTLNASHMCVCVMSNNLITINRKLHIYKEFYVSINGHRTLTHFRCAHSTHTQGIGTKDEKRNETLSCVSNIGIYHLIIIVGLIAAIHWHTIIYLHVNSKMFSRSISFTLAVSAAAALRVFVSYSNLQLTNGRTTKRPCWSIYVSFFWMIVSRKFCAMSLVVVAVAIDNK